MDITYPNRKQAVAMATAILLVPILFQALRGGDVEDFFSRLLLATTAVLLTWRWRMLTRFYDAPRTTRTRLHFMFSVVFWIVVAGALFAGFKFSSM